MLVVFLILKVLTDLGYITHDSKLWHGADAAGRTLLFSYVSILELGFTHKAYSITILFLATFWIGFDMVINRARHLPLMYVGSGTIDLFVRSIAFKYRIPSDWLMLLLKGLIYICSLVYILIVWLK